MISRAGSEALERLIALNADYCAAEGVPHDPDRARAGLAPLLIDDAHGSVWWVHDQSGAVDGYAVVAHSWSVEVGGPEVVLDELYVRHRGRGTGGQALEELAEVLRQQGFRRIFLETERSNNRARRLYERHGFVEQDSIWMSRDL